MSFPRNVTTPTMTMAGDWMPNWVPGVLVGVVGWILAHLRASRVEERAEAKAKAVMDRQVALIKERQTAAKEDERQYASDLRAAVQSLQSVGADLRVLTAGQSEMKETFREFRKEFDVMRMASTEQAVMSKMTVHMLEGLSNRVDGHDKMFNEFGQQLSLMRELMTGECKPTKPCWTEGHRTE